MHRREFLRGTALAALTGLAGCSGVIGDVGGPPPKTYLERPATSASHGTRGSAPSWGQQLPTSTLPGVFHGAPVTIPGDFSGRNVFLTWFYSHGPKGSAATIGALRSLQRRALNVNYRTVFVAATFDPRQDIGRRLRAYAKAEYVDLGAGDWYFLRPETPANARAVATGKYGVQFSKNHGSGGVQHYSYDPLVFLVNDRGYVERTYKRANPDRTRWRPMWRDLETLRQQEGKPVSLR